ncbi:MULTISPECIES: GGDEF domain-containing protein [Pseudoalteromonas]|uniref:GGDEF domain-containing protein n=1 Tax=Pseudoalteromonas TaxID=53246 RepID=UPI00026CDEAD|nr:GGDEF domain-containing protein [Pseudoalteromonas spongiae]ATD00084.1 hypothetical protein PSPO_a3253 [Pseudoalteromonas spongiae UST010723-006]
MQQNNSHTTDLWRSFIEVDGLHSAELKRRVFSFLAMSGIALVVFSGLLLANFQTYPWLLSITLLGALIAVFINVVIYFSTRQLKYCSIGIALTVLLLSILLVYTGGKENTALYWIMFYPVVVFTMLGVRSGLLLTALALSAIVFQLYGPDFGQANYGHVEKSRFLSGFSLVVFFAFISEYFRDKSHQAITNITYNQKQKANTDALTGLPNRRFIDAIFLTKMEKNTAELLPMAVIMCDIDRFKDVNDNYGHDIGDKALMHIAKLMQNQLRYSDVVARYGGEEFIICLPHASMRQAVQIAEKLRKNIEEHPVNLESGENLALTASFGVAEVHSVVAFYNAVKQADEALYRAKRSGRNRVATL